MAQKVKVFVEQVGNMSLSLGTYTKVNSTKLSNLHGYAMTPACTYTKIRKQIQVTIIAACAFIYFIIIYIFIVLQVLSELIKDLSTLNK